MKGVYPLSHLRLTLMSGCARSNGITADRMLSSQAWCNKVFWSSSSIKFTLKPGSCLISSASFFVSPPWTAANMIQPRQRLGKKEKRRRRRNKEEKEKKKNENEILEYSRIFSKILENSRIFSKIIENSRKFRKIKENSGKF